MAFGVFEVAVFGNFHGVDCGGGGEVEEEEEEDEKGEEREGSVWRERGHHRLDQAGLVNEVSSSPRSACNRRCDVQASEQP